MHPEQTCIDMPLLSKTNTVASWVSRIFWSEANRAVDFYHIGASVSAIRGGVQKQRRARLVIPCVGCLRTSISCNHFMFIFKLDLNFQEWIICVFLSSLLEGKKKEWCYLFFSLPGLCSHNSLLLKCVLWQNHLSKSSSSFSTKLTCHLFDDAASDIPIQNESLPGPL